MATTFIFAGGGTGGHLYPGLAIAEELGRLAADRGLDAPRLLFVCSDRPLDAEILRARGVPFLASRARPFSVRPRGLVRFARSWGASVRQGRGAVREARQNGEVRVVAMGGFVAAPVVQAARVERVPVALVNLDAVPGKANRWIARHAGAGVFSSTPVRRGLRGAGGWTVVPPIVRAGAAVRGSQAECRRRLGLAPDRPVLMVTGGSQGARSVNEFVTGFAAGEPGAGLLRDGGWQILHQTGRDADAPAAQAYRAAGISALVTPFSDAMGDWWGAADVAVARAGAGNVGEVWASGVPTLFLPYPYHKDEHQRYNALMLEEAGGAVIARDLISPERNLGQNSPLLADLIRDPQRRARMRAALGALGPADGAARVAGALLDTLP